MLLVLTLVNGLSRDDQADSLQALRRGNRNKGKNDKIDRLLAEVGDLQDKVDALLAQPSPSQPSSSPGVAGKCFAESTCAEILQNNANAPSGDYLLQDQVGRVKTVHCDMTRSCGGVTGGWMRVGFFDMTDHSQQCPNSLKMRTVGPASNVRVCTPLVDAASCSSVTFPLNGDTYSKVCGKIRGYYGGTLDGFQFTGRTTASANLETNYVDGVSLTRGRSPRHHIWSFSTAYNADQVCGNVPA